MLEETVAEQNFLQFDNFPEKERPKVLASLSSNALIASYYISQSAL